MLRASRGTRTAASVGLKGVDRAAEIADAIHRRAAQKAKDLLASMRRERVYRVEGLPNKRILVREGGMVDVHGERTLFLNFGNRARAEEFLARRLQQGMPGATLKSFVVPRGFVDELRGAAVTESLVYRFPERPILVDITKAPDQFGLRPPQIERLKRVIVPGSGVEGH